MDNDRCPVCNKRYKDFRCSLEAFWQVKAEMYNPAELDPKNWRYKHRKGVLGYWHERKKTEWENHLIECNGDENERCITDCDNNSDTMDELYDFGVY